MLDLPTGTIALNYIKDSKILIDTLKEGVWFVGCSKSLSSLRVSNSQSFGPLALKTFRNQKKKKSSFKASRHWKTCHWWICFLSFSLSLLHFWRERKLRWCRWNKRKRKETTKKACVLNRKELSPSVRFHPSNLKNIPLNVGQSQVRFLVQVFSWGKTLRDLGL